MGLGCFLISRLTLAWRHRTSVRDGPQVLGPALLLLLLGSVGRDGSAVQMVASWEGWLSAGSGRREVSAGVVSPSRANKGSAKTLLISCCILWLCTGSNAWGMGRARKSELKRCAPVSRALYTVQAL